MTWLLLGLGCFVLGMVVGVAVAVAVASSATAREIERLEQQWALEPRP